MKHVAFALLLVAYAAFVGWWGSVAAVVMLVVYMRHGGELGRRV